MGVSNAELFKFDDFTLGHYRELLRFAKRTYTFRSFNDYSLEERFVIWRHDIDFSISRSLIMAKLEKEENIRSTYYVQLHSEFYNTFEKSNVKQLQTIAKLGHRLGLHFDSHFFEIENEAQLDNCISSEASILRNLLQVPIESFSFHVTTPFTLSCKKESYGGLINVYSEFFTSHVGYCSDSNGYWRHRRLKDVLIAAEDKSLQVLTHPGLWRDEVMSPLQRVKKSINERAEATWRWYEEILKQNGRENIDW
jgi:hypothetical protein